MHHKTKRCATTVGYIPSVQDQISAGRNKFICLRIGFNEVRESTWMPHPTNPPLLGSSIFATTHGASAHTKAMPTINCISSSDDPIEGELTDVVLISRDRLQNPFLQWKETVESEY